MSDAGITALPAPVPMTVGRILDCIWAILRRHFALFLRLGAVPAAAMILVYGIVFGSLFALGEFPPNAHEPNPTRVVYTLFAAILAAMIPMMAAYALFEAASCSAALQARRGIASTFTEAYGVAWRHAGRYIALMILRALCISLPFLLIGAAFAAASLFVGSQATTLHPGVLFLIFPLMVLAYLGSMVYAVWMTLRLVLAVPASINEDLPAVAALKRSAQLTRKAKGRMFVVFLVVYALGQAAFIVFEIVAGAVFGVGVLVAASLHLDPHSAWLIVPAVLVGLCFFAAMLAWMGTIWASYAITFSVLYEDQLLRTGGLVPALPGGEPA